MSECHSLTMPCDKSRNGMQSDLVATEDVSYRRAVGSLMFLAVAARPHYAFGVGVVKYKETIAIIH